jgi:hypothetical protein
VVTEVWLGQFGKWAMVDGQWGAIAERQGVPLNAVELQDAIARRDPALTIRFALQTATADRQAKYIRWIIPYLYYLKFDFDQRFYRSMAQGLPPQQGHMMLIPKGAPKPRAFQRHTTFQGCTYISNPRAFYPLCRGRSAAGLVPTLHPGLLIWAQEGSPNDHKTAGWLDNEAWMIIGPFDNTDGAGFETPYSPEKEIDFSKEYPGKEKAVKWFRPKPGPIDGFLDLAALIGRKDWVVAYAAVSLESPQARMMELRVGSDDDFKAWLNGELVLSRNADRGAVADQDVAAVTLRKGENQLLLKICNRLYSWGFYARVVDANVPRQAD